MKKGIRDCSLNISLLVPQRRCLLHLKTDFCLQISHLYQKYCLDRFPFFPEVLSSDSRALGLKKGLCFLL